MKLSELSPAAGSTRENYRKGRGAGSGNGKTAGKGHKGQNARSGGGVRVGFEGGQIPLYRRLPKRGFKNRFATVYTVVNLCDIDAKFNNGDVVDLAALKAAGLVKKENDGVKILGQGDITKALTVKADKFSESAKAKIEAVGGTAEVI